MQNFWLWQIFRFRLTTFLIFMFGNTALHQKNFLLFTLRISLASKMSIEWVITLTHNASLVHNIYTSNVTFLFAHNSFNFLYFRSVVRLAGYDNEKQEISRPSELLKNVKVFVGLNLYFKDIKISMPHFELCCAFIWYLQILKNIHFINSLELQI